MTYLIEVATDWAGRSHIQKESPKNEGYLQGTLRRFGVKYYNYISFNNQKEFRIETINSFTYYIRKYLDIFGLFSNTHYNHVKKSIEDSESASPNLKTFVDLQKMKKEIVGAWEKSHPSSKNETESISTNLSPLENWQDQKIEEGLPKKMVPSAKRFNWDKAKNVGTPYNLHCTNLVKQIENEGFEENSTDARIHLLFFLCTGATTRYGVTNIFKKSFYNNNDLKKSHRNVLILINSQNDLDNNEGLITFFHTKKEDWTAEQKLSESKLKEFQDLLTKVDKS